MLATDSAFLEKAFNTFNMVYYEGVLPNVVITIQSRPKSYGYITVNKIWEDSVDNYHEINISAEYLNRPIENVLATLQHEMVHLYCIVVGIADTSKGGRYHNKNFKIEAEKRGLHIEYDKYVGYSRTTPTEEFIHVLATEGLFDMLIDHHRQEENSVVQPPIVGGSGGAVVGGKSVGKQKGSTRKYICPTCNVTIRATKDVNIICGDCMCVMEKA